MIVSTTADDSTDSNTDKNTATIKHTVTNADASAAPANESSSGKDDMKVKYLIKAILTKEQIVHIQKVGLWYVFVDCIAMNMWILGANAVHVFVYIMCARRPAEFVLDPKLAKKEMTKDDLMPDYDSGSDYDYEYDDSEDVKVDKMGNTIIDDEVDDNEEN